MQELEQMFESIINNGLTDQQKQRLNYIRGTVMEPKFGYYASQQMPNGTHDMIVTDRDGTIVGYIESALFGIPWSKFKAQFDMYNYIDSDSIYAVKASEIDSNGDENIAGYIGDDTSDDWKRYIAISPVQTIDDILTKLEQIIK